MKILSRTGIIILVSLLLLLLVACGDDDETKIPTETPLPTETQGSIEPIETVEPPVTEDPTETVEPTKPESSYPFRLISIRFVAQLQELSAATIQDRDTFLIHLLKIGDKLPDHDEFVLSEIGSDHVILEKDIQQMELRLENDTPLYRDATDEEIRQGTDSLMELAERGTLFPGLVGAQWYAMGLRERAYLLQQGWLNPDYGGVRGPDKEMIGLRVKEVSDRSFWDQLGLEVDDLIKEINGMPVDSFEAWHKVLEYVENSTDITVVVERGSESITMRTVTIPPR